MNDAAPSLKAVLTRLYARIPLGMRLGLGPMREACATAGHPEAAFEAVHVAGTNGKGSVCAMVESIARAHGLRTGLYTSPHLARFAERIRLDGEPIGDCALAPLLARALDLGPELSFFEAATLAAFLAFREARVDIAVLEVGLGGRLDATNVIPRPRAAAITRIALDHTDRLGPTLADIAREKAGIAKPGLDLLLGPMPAGVRAAIDEVAHASGATTTLVGDVESERGVGVVGLAGAHQRENARIAAALARRLGAKDEAIRAGIAGVRWPGRLERIGPFLLDAAHNPDGADALARHVSALAADGRDGPGSRIAPHDVALVFGTLADKDWPPMLDVLAPLASVRRYVAPQGGARSAADAAPMASRHPGTVHPSLEDALAPYTDVHARSAPPALVLIAGSIALVGQARSLLLGLPRDPPVAL